MIHIIRYFLMILYHIGALFTKNYFQSGSNERKEYCDVANPWLAAQGSGCLGHHRVIKIGRPFLQGSDVNSNIREAKPGHDKRI